jgi:hypothetical protein
VPVRRASLLLLAIVVLAGCGGSGKRLTRQEYASKADAICTDFKQRVQALDNPSNLDDLADVADKTISILDNAIDDLRKLRPPSGEQDTADRWLDQLQTLTDDLGEVREKAKDGDLQGVQALVPKATDHDSQAKALATELGMSVCNAD